MELNAKECLAWNSQSNAILERKHQVLADCLVSIELEDVNINFDNPDPFEEYLSIVSYIIRSAFHTTHGHSPRQLVFRRDIFIPIDVPIDWTAIKEQKQKTIRKRNERETLKQIHFQYTKGDYMTIQKPDILKKLSFPRLGPYKVWKHYANVDITYEKAPNVTDKVNTRRIYPYYKKDSE